MRISTVIADIIMIANRDHSDLQDLLADDHTQYFDIAGVRPPTLIKSGNTAARPASPTVGDIYYDTQAGKLYLCKTATSWSQAIPALHIGRHASGGADALSAAQVAGLMLLVATTRGDILIRGASTVQRLAPGSSGQALLSGGAGADPYWGVAALWSELDRDTVTGANTMTLNFAAHDWIKVFIKIINRKVSAQAIQMRLNGVSDAEYDCIAQTGGTFSTEANLTQIDIIKINEGDGGGMGEMLLKGRHIDGRKSFKLNCIGDAHNLKQHIQGVLLTDSNDLTSITIFAGSNFDAEVIVYGLNY